MLVRQLRDVWVSTRPVPAKLSVISRTAAISGFVRMFSLGRPGVEVSRAAAVSLSPKTWVAQATALFRRARLQLIALDCEPCALASLSDALGTGDADGARRQHLSAVSVLPESESAAEALGEDLAVPVGLAVAWFGAGRAR